MSVLVANEDARRRSWAAIGMVAVAWLALVVWSLSPWATWMQHGYVDIDGAALPQRLVLFALGWMLMVIAMMLPGSLPVVASGAIGAMGLAAWSAVWALFGVFSYLGDSLLHEIVHRVPALADSIAPSLLLVAGVYQLTPAKRHFLMHCSPKSIEVAAVHQSTHTWRRGLEHGLDCVGSCWALMLLMMAFGGFHLAGMLVLGALMSAEQLATRGVRLARVVGIALIAMALILAALSLAPSLLGGTHSSHSH